MGSKFLQAVLPMVAGAALSPFMTPMGAAAVVGGLGALRAKKVDNAATGDALLSGIMTGMGAYGGANIAANLGTVSAPKVATTGAKDALTQNYGWQWNVGGSDKALINAPSSAATVNAPVASIGSGTPALPTYAEIAQGAKAATTPAGWKEFVGASQGASGLLTDVGMAAAPAVPILLEPAPFNPPAPTTYSIRPYSYNSGYTGGTQEGPGYPGERRWFQPAMTALPPVLNTDYSAFADGGDVQAAGLGAFSDGGRLLKGPGDGVSDSIPAVIDGKHPARLADGEFVIPAFDVATIGNGSTEAGARKLYAMLDRLEAARRRTKSGEDAKADRHLPA